MFICFAFVVDADKNGAKLKLVNIKLILNINSFKTN